MGGANRFFANHHISIDEVLEGPFILATLIGSPFEMDEAVASYLRIYPKQAYDTVIVFQACNEEKELSKRKKIVTLRRYRSSD